MFYDLYDLKLIHTIIPFYNIFKSATKSVSMINNSNILYNSMDKVNIIEMIEPEKQKEFEKDPTIFKAKELIRKHERELKNLSVIFFHDDNVVIFDTNDKSINQIKRIYGSMNYEDKLTRLKRLNHAIELYQTYLKTCYEDLYHEEFPQDKFDEIKTWQFQFDLRKIDDSISVDEFRELTKRILHTEEDEYNDEYAKGIKRIRRR